MTKGKHGNKEAKKPKKAPPPPAPLTAADALASTLAVAPQRAKKH